MKRKNNRKGFTIVELVIVIAVIAILATVLVPTFGDMIEKSKQTAIIEEAKNLYTDYMIKHASDDDFTDDVVIEIDGKYYAVKDGALILDTDGEKAKEFTSDEEAAATFLDGDDTYFVVMHDNKEIETIPTTSDDENEGGENAGNDQNNGNP